MRRTIALLVTSSFLCFSGVVKADEAQVRAQLEDVSRGLVSSLDLSERIVLKVLSPEQSGLPVDFLRKLSSDLEAALLVASDFQIDLTNRLTTEELWTEAVEFMDADFNELYAASQADVMLLLSPRATAAGVEISIAAYSLTGVNAGRVLASSGSTLLPIKVAESLGVDVVNLNAQMAQVLQEIERVGQTGGLISDPSTYAEYYHNARLLQQRGEVDLAMRNYEEALTQGFLFVDPLLDILDLANARYGEAGTKIFFENRIKDAIPKELAILGTLVLGGDPMELVQPILDKEITFSPLLAMWIQKTYMDWSRFDTLTIGKARAVAADLISAHYRSGAFQTFFIDKIRGAGIGQSATQTYDSMINSGGQLMIDRNQISRAEVRYQRYFRGSCENSLDVPLEMAWFDRFTISDPVDTTKPVILCVRAYPQTVQRDCLDLRENGAYILPNRPDQHSFTATTSRSPESCSSFDFTVGMHCVDSVEYTDMNGFKVNSPVLVSHEQRLEYAPEGLDEIVECAGDFYRP